MEKKIFKILGSLLLIIFLLLGFTVYSQKDRQNLEVDFLDVGQGDAILIKTPYEQNILIDGGPNTKVLSQLGRHLAFFDKNLDLVILTHPHSDHVAGLVEVLRRYKVKKVLMTGVVHTSPDYETFLQEIDKQKIESEKADGPKDISLGNDLVLKILYPLTDLSGQKVEELNNSSIVAKLIYQDNSFLLTGDAEELAEQDLINSETDLKASVLKIAHHGSKYSTTQNFLDAVKPQFAVISVGKNNDFGHPHLRTLDTLKNNQIEYYRTDLQGTIIFISDGQVIKIKAGK
jgi:competence protein ComEC